MEKKSWNKFEEDRESHPALQGAKRGHRAEAAPEEVYWETRYMGGGGRTTKKRKKKPKIIVWEET